MTPQEIFDAVWDWFVVQNHGKSLNESGVCAYRGEYGERCAFGVIIPDDSYDPGMEGLGVLPVLWRFDSLRSHLGIDLEQVDDTRCDDKSAVKLIIILQKAHDGAWEENFAEEVTERFTAIAQEYGLQVPEAI